MQRGSRHSLGRAETCWDMSMAVLGDAKGQSTPPRACWSMTALSGLKPVTILTKDGTSELGKSCLKFVAIDRRDRCGEWALLRFKLKEPYFRTQAALWMSSVAAYFKPAIQCTSQAPRQFEKCRDMSNSG
eukprot:257268-Pelagomonas_calceolata.AAC.2